MVIQLHQLLATTTVIVVALVAIEAAWRLARNRPPGMWSGRLAAATIVVIAITAAGGLGILVGGGAPAESLHFVYALIAIFAVPLALTFTRRLSARPAAAVVLVIDLALLVVLMRLFQTG